MNTPSDISRLAMYSSVRVEAPLFTKIDLVACSSWITVRFSVWLVLKLPTNWILETDARRLFQNIKSKVMLSTSIIFLG